MKPLPAIVLLLCAAFATRAQGHGDVRIYRCTDASGKQSLRDTPCPKGQAQQARDMQRPQDAPKPPRPTPPPAAPGPAPAPAPVVFLAPPRPLYECTTPDGDRYTSENGEGNPRWVPLWTLGYPVARRQTSLGSNIGGRHPRPGDPSRPPPHGIHWPVAAAGGWIRDDCAMLPPAEACARLRDRRSEIRTRFFNAMPSERDLLRVEERTINARLANDCGGA
jgi:hypothetical protein